MINININLNLLFILNIFKKYFKITNPKLIKEYRKFFEPYLKPAIIPSLLSYIIAIGIYSYTYKCWTLLKWSNDWSTIIFVGLRYILFYVTIVILMGLSDKYLEIYSRRWKNKLISTLTPYSLPILLYIGIAGVCFNSEDISLRAISIGGSILCFHSYRNEKKFFMVISLLSLSVFFIFFIYSFFKVLFILPLV